MTALAYTDYLTEFWRRPGPFGVPVGIALFILLITLRLENAIRDSKESKKAERAPAEFSPISKPIKLRNAQPKIHPHTRVISWILVALFLAFIATLYFAFESTPYANQTQNSTNSIPPASSTNKNQPVPLLASNIAPSSTNKQPMLLFLGGSWHREDDYVVITGKVTNLSDDSMSSVEAVVSFYAPDDTFITSEDQFLDLNPIPPQQTSDFKVMAHYKPQIDMRNAKLSFRKFLGSDIPFATERSTSNQKESSRESNATIATFKPTPLPNPPTKALLTPPAVPSRSPAITLEAASSPLAPLPTFFTVGSSRAVVISVQGRPDFETETTLSYGMSTIVLNEDGNVTSWTDASKNLRAK